MGYNPKKSVWLNPDIEYIFGDEIIEYDIRDAGFNLIRQYKLLPEEKIKELLYMEKMERHITIGKIQGADKDFSDVLMNKFAEIRSIFINTNKIRDNDIISVKKDALFIIGEQQRTKFGMVEFRDKNRYSSYIRFPNIRDLEIYYGEDNFDIKGMGDSAISRHRLYMIEFLRNIISMLENSDIRIKRYLKKFIDNYKFHNLDEEYYLEFNSKSTDINYLFNYQNIILPITQIVIKLIGE